MNENIETMKKTVAKKQESQRKAVEKEEKFDEYVQGLLDSRGGQKEAIQKNADDLDRMTEILDRMTIVAEEHGRAQVKLNRMIADDPWVFGDPEEGKLENNPEYTELLESFLQMGRDLFAAKTEVNKIYYRR